MSDLTDALSRYFTDAGNYEDLDYLSAYGYATQALLYFPLYFPRLTVYRDMVFLDKVINYDEAQARVDASLAEKGPAVADSFNWVEVIYEFNNRDLNEADIRVLAECMRVAWTSWLHHSFPARRFVVRIMEAEETGSVLGVGFKEIHHPNS